MLFHFSKTPFRKPSYLKLFKKLIHIDNWNESKIITRAKSRFQGRTVTLTEADDISAILHQFLVDHKNIAKSASHPHIIAWRTGQEVVSFNKETNKLKKVTADYNKLKKYTNVNQGHKDNGEKGAGIKLLQLLIKNDIMNVMVIVTRWYGGNPLGSKRFRCINNCALDSLRKANKI